MPQVVVPELPPQVTISDESADENMSVDSDVLAELEHELFDTPSKPSIPVPLHTPEKFRLNFKQPPNQTSDPRMPAADQLAIVPYSPSERPLPRASPRPQPLADRPFTLIPLMDKPVDTRTQQLPFHGIGPMASDYTNETKKRKQEAIDKLKAAKATEDKKKQGKKAVKEAKDNKEEGSDEATPPEMRALPSTVPSTEKIEEILKKYVVSADVHPKVIHKRVFSAAYHHVYHKNCSPDVKAKASEFANKIVKKWMGRNKLTLADCK